MGRLICSFPTNSQFLQVFYLGQLQCTGVGPFLLSSSVFLDDLKRRSYQNSKISKVTSLRNLFISGPTHLVYVYRINFSGCFAGPAESPLPFLLQFLPCLLEFAISKWKKKDLGGAGLGTSTLDFFRLLHPYRSWK